MSKSMSIQDDRDSLNEEKQPRRNPLGLLLGGGGIGFMLGVLFTIRSVWYAHLILAFAGLCIAVVGELICRYYPIE